MHLVGNLRNLRKHRKYSDRPDEQMVPLILNPQQSLRIPDVQTPRGRMEESIPFSFVMGMVVVHLLFFCVLAFVMLFYFKFTLLKDLIWQIIFLPLYFLTAIVSYIVYKAFDDLKESHPKIYKVMKCHLIFSTFMILIFLLVLGTYLDGFYLAHAQDMNSNQSSAE